MHDTIRRKHLLEELAPMPHSRTAGNNCARPPRLRSMIGSLDMSTSTFTRLCAVRVVIAMPGHATPAIPIPVVHLKPALLLYTVRACIYALQEIWYYTKDKYWNGADVLGHWATWQVAPTAQHQGV